MKASSYPPANNSAILNLYKESDQADTIEIVQNSAESVQNPSDLFSINEMVSIHCASVICCHNLNSIFLLMYSNDQWSELLVSSR